MKLSAVQDDAGSNSNAGSNAGRTVSARPSAAIETTIGACDAAGDECGNSTLPCRRAVCARCHNYVHAVAPCAGVFDDYILLCIRCIRSLEASDRAAAMERERTSLDAPSRRTLGTRSDEDNEEEEDKQLQLEAKPEVAAAAKSNP